MTGFLKCLAYLAGVGMASFLIGRILPKSWFQYERFPYRSFSFEKNGKIYEKIKIRKWKDVLPDMSRIFPKLIPSKRPASVMTAEQINDMIRETCVAEFIHTLLCVMGIGCIFLWDGTGGISLCVLYILGNIPFNLIQRYNRPKFIRVLDKMNTKKKTDKKRHTRRNEMKKTLILSCSTGQGHNSCAHAVEEYFIKKGVACQTEDALAFISPGVAEFMSKGHSWMYRHIPGFFRWGYHFSEEHPELFRDESVIYRFLTKGAEPLYHYIEQNKFDTIICTHVFSAMILTDIMKKYPLDVETAFVATDYTCSPSTEKSNLDYYFIPDEALADHYIKCGIPEERIVATGLPVQQGFGRYVEKADAKRLLGVQANHRHLLIMCGSMGCGPIRKIVKIISKYMTSDMEVSVICGANEKLRKKLDKLTVKNSNIHIVGYTHQIPMYLDSADLYLTKPGGISVTEAARKKVPMVFVNAVAGCEAYNMKFFLEKGAAITADTPKKLAGECIRLLHAKEERMQMEQAMKEYSLPDGAGEIFREMNGGISAWKKVV